MIPEDHTSKDLISVMHLVDKQGTKSGNGPILCLALSRILLAAYR